MSAKNPDKKHGRVNLYLPDKERWAEFIAACKEEGVSPSHQVDVLVKWWLASGE